MPSFELLRFPKQAVAHKRAWSPIFSRVEIFRLRERGVIESVKSSLGSKHRPTLVAHHTVNCGGQCLIELIRARAFQLYEARGREPGCASLDWLQAEREVKQILGFEPVGKEAPTPSSKPLAHS